MVFGKADMNFGLHVTNSYTPDSVCAPLAPIKVGRGKRRPVEIITDITLDLSRISTRESWISSRASYPETDCKPVNNYITSSTISGIYSSQKKLLHILS